MKYAAAFSGRAYALECWRAIGFHGDYRRSGCRWQADHIHPVVEGGGGCGLENLQLLCTPCHAEKTAALCRDRAARRRDAIPTAPAGAGAVMNIGAAFPSKYLKAATLGDQVARVRIDHVATEDVSGKGEDPKPVLYFIGKDKGMVLNKTNANIIRGAYGDETDDWHGKPVEIYVADVQFAGDMVAGLRVRIPKASTGNQGAKPAPKAAEPSPVSDDPQFQEADIPF
jgi:hypothetical protein